MIQLLGLRARFDGKGNYDKLFELKDPPKSPKDLFSRLEHFLAQIPPAEHWNLFYTIAASGPKKREFQATKTIAFDIDKINHKYEDAYIEVVLSALGLQRDQVGIVSSGNGYHFLIELTQEITDKGFFEQSRAHYKAVCTKIDDALKRAGIPGSADTAIFDARRILRVPGTINRKVDKPEKRCELISPIGHAVDFRLEALSGLPTVTKAEQVDKRIVQKYSKVYPAAVLEGCSFLKACQESPNEVDEPAWYAALSIVSRLDGEGSTGRARCHDMSRGHRSYSAEETDKKVDQALDSSGPRTCESINGIWGKCRECPNFDKLSNGPLFIRGENAIPTEDSGFHNSGKDSKGRLKFTPNHEDLIAYFKREQGFKVLGDSRQVYVWNGTHYAEKQKASLEAFAREKFDPKPAMDVVREFRQRVEISNITPVEWWEASVGRKMNFKNGYLDIDTMDFRPHDQEIAFRNVLPYEYDPAARAPSFEKMLKLVTGNEPATIEVLLEFIGYCLSNDRCWAQKALVLTGDGANGKSTFLDTLKALAGKGNYASNNLAKIDSDYNLANLDRRLFNISEETSPKALLDNATFKNLVTGGTFLVRLPYKEPFEIANRSKQFLTCNALPETLDNTHGFYRRLLIVPFDQTITPDTRGYDPRMLDKLVAELPGIFNLAIEAYHRLVARGRFTDSEQVAKTMEEYRLENDSVLYWVTNHLVVHRNGGFEDHFTPTGDLYAAYRDAMKAANRIPVHLQKFTKQLAKLRPDFWGEHPYGERSIRKTVEVRGKNVQVRGLQGVEVEVLN